MHTRSHTRHKRALAHLRLVLFVVCSYDFYHLSLSLNLDQAEQLLKKLEKQTFFCKFLGGGGGSFTAVMVQRAA